MGSDPARSGLVASGLERSGSMYSSRPLNCLLLVEKYCRTIVLQYFQRKAGVGGGGEGGGGWGGGFLSRPEEKKSVPLDQAVEMIYSKPRFMFEIRFPFLQAAVI